MTKRKRCIIVGLTVLAAAAAALAVMLTRNRPAFIVKHVIYEAMDANSTVNSRWWAYDINALELLQGGYNTEKKSRRGSNIIRSAKKALCRCGRKLAGSTLLR